MRQASAYVLARWLAMFRKGRGGVSIDAEKSIKEYASFAATLQQGLIIMKFTTTIEERYWKFFGITHYIDRNFSTGF